MNTQSTASWGVEEGLRGAIAMMWGQPTDWRTAPLEKEGDQGKALALIKLLGGLAVEHKLQRILSPNVSRFDSAFLNDTFQHPWRLTLPGTACKLHRGLYGDGFEVYPGDAGIIAPADCAVVVVTTPSGRVLMLHAGRDSLIDRKLIMSKGYEKSKDYESIIFAAWSNLYQASKEDALGSKWLILPSISAGDHFQHNWRDEHRSYENEQVVTYLVKKYDHAVRGHAKFGMIDIPAIIAAQLTQFCGVDRDNITADSRCTYTEVDAAENHVWHSHARAIHKGQNPKARNLVVVINTRKP